MVFYVSRRVPSAQRDLHVAPPRQDGPVDQPTAEGAEEQGRDPQPSKQLSGGFWNGDTPTCFCFYMLIMFIKCVWVCIVFHEFVMCVYIYIHILYKYTYYIYIHTYLCVCIYPVVNGASGKRSYRYLYSLVYEELVQELYTKSFPTTLGILYTHTSYILYIYIYIHIPLGKFEHDLTVLPHWYIGEE